MKGRQIEELITAPHSPWQNAYAEQVIGGVRWECLDHLIILSEGHLRRVLREYFRYYNNSRPDQSLEKNSPIPRVAEPRRRGPVIPVPEVGGLHHRHERAACRLMWTARTQVRR